MATPNVDLSRTYFGSQQSHQLSQLLLEGIEETPDTTTVLVDKKDEKGRITAAHGEDVPENDETGYKKGCEFLETDAEGNGLYINAGDEDACEFEPVGTISAGSVDTEQLADDAVDADKLADDAVDTGAIQDDAVTQDKIGDEAVGTDQIEDESVASEDIEDDTIRWNDMSSYVVKRAIVQITAAELKDLATNPKVLVAGVTGKFLELISALAHFTPGSEALAEDGGGSNLAIKYGDATGVQVTEDLEMTGFIDEATDTLLMQINRKDGVILTKDDIADQGFVLDNIGAGDLTGNATGDAELTVIVVYREFDV